MKKVNVDWRCCAVMALGILCGCETVTVPPKPPSGPNGPKSEISIGLQRYDLESATSLLMSKMLSSAAFQRNYAAVVKAKGGRPVIVVGKIENNLHNKRPDCEIVRNNIQVSLNEPGLYDVKMDGFEGAVDYQVTGYVKSDYDDANPGHDANPRLHLKILDANSGQIIWSGTQNNLQL